MDEIDEIDRRIAEINKRIEELKLKGVSINED